MIPDVWVLMPVPHTGQWGKPTPASEKLRGKSDPQAKTGKR